MATVKYNLKIGQSKLHADIDRVKFTTFVTLSQKLKKSDLYYAACTCVKDKDNNVRLAPIHLTEKKFCYLIFSIFIFTLFSSTILTYTHIL